MGRSKNNKNTSNGLGQARKETREERRQRILAEAEARKKCLEMLPHAGAFVSLCVFIFYLWAKSVPETMPHPKQSFPQQYKPPIPVFTDTDNFSSDNHRYSSNTSGHKVTNRERKEYNGPKITPTKVRDLGDEVFEL